MTDWDLWLLQALHVRLASSQDAFHFALSSSDRVPWIVMSLLLCWMWFVGSPRLLPRRPGGILNLHARHLASSCILIMPGLFLVSQYLQRYIARPRPLHVEGLLSVPIPPQLWQAVADSFSAGSAFPSDHAVVMGLLAVCLWRLHRFVGVVFVLWSLLVLMLRVALGFHWPSDILAGWLIGMLAGLMVVWLMPYQWMFAQRLALWVERRPALAHAMLLLFLYDFSQKFSWSFAVGHALGMVE